MVSDLVTDWKLVVRFSAKHTHHVVFVSDARPAIPKQTPFPQPIDYKHELEAISKFSQTKARSMHTTTNHNVRVPLKEWKCEPSQPKWNL